MSGADQATSSRTPKRDRTAEELRLAGLLEQVIQLFIPHVTEVFGPEIRAVRQPLLTADEEVRLAVLLYASLLDELGTAPTPDQIEEKKEALRAKARSCFEKDIYDTAKLLVTAWLRSLLEAHADLECLDDAMLPNLITKQIGWDMAKSRELLRRVKADLPAGESFPALARELLVLQRARNARLFP